MIAARFHTPNVATPSDWLEQAAAVVGRNGGAIVGLTDDGPKVLLRQGMNSAVSGNIIRTAVDGGAVAETVDLADFEAVVLLDDSDVRQLVYYGRRKLRLTTATLAVTIFFVLAGLYYSAAAAGYAPSSYASLLVHKPSGEVLNLTIWLAALFSSIVPIMAVCAILSHRLKERSLRAK